jgi:hypothetical protein
MCGTIIRCADGKQAINELNHRRNLYHWIFIETTREDSNAQDTLVGHIHAMDMNIPISLITHQFDTSASLTTAHPSSACSIKDGFINRQKQHRVLDALQEDTQRTPHGFSKYKLDDIFLYEYHAPCKKPV